jgi:uncharacterized protein (TIGR02646 family)
LINRTRPEMPPSIRRNASRWKRDLLEQIDISDRTGQEVPKRYFDRYKKDDVKLALSTMYKGLCCYCDSRIGVVDFPHIEHRKPKDKELFPEAAFEWDNLHLACTLCNNAKSNQWDDANPILDAVTDIPITDHLDYRLELCIDKTPRGETTRLHADLNREGLVTARTEILLSSLLLIEEINMGRRGWRVEEAKRQLSKLSEGQYGSFIDYIKRVFLK